MRDFFKQNKIIVGVVVGLGSEILMALLLWIGLNIAGEQPLLHQRWFGACFIAPLLLLRHYAKRKEQPLVTKTLITILFLTFVGFMFVVYNEVLSNSR